ncbi:MAG: 4-hydroxy-tetrahydrodipicolinate reductase [Candidatus Gracilibacteria bacterium]|jgi:4-hydroxy-tetrahydrodipicolinate reductase
MKIALIGYGGMGKTLHRIAKERNHEVPIIIDPMDPLATHKSIQNADLETADVAIDFSSAESAISNIDLCNKTGVNLVVGTTGWYEKLPEIKELLKENKIGFLWSSNFSIGVNLYFAIMEKAAKLINNFDEYDVWGHEIHHYNKADSPSGTAKTLGKILLDNITRKTAVVEDRLNRKREPNEIHFSSVRGGQVNFGHTIGFDSPADTITISHSARNRDGYALGAIKAAEWLQGKKGFFEMKDFLNFN